MHTTINQSQFIELFKSIRPDNFSYEGLKALFNYIEELEQDLGIQTDVDVITICCTYSEEPITAVLDNYNLESLEELKEHTIVLNVSDDTIIYAAY